MAWQGSSSKTCPTCHGTGTLTETQSRENPGELCRCGHARFHHTGTPGDGECLTYVDKATGGPRTYRKGGGVEPDKPCYCKKFARPE